MSLRLFVCLFVVGVVDPVAALRLKCLMFVFKTTKIKNSNKVLSKLGNI